MGGAMGPLAEHTLSSTPQPASLVRLDVLLLPPALPRAGIGTAPRRACPGCRAGAPAPRGARGLHLGPAAGRATILFQLRANDLLGPSLRASRFITLSN